MSETCWMQKYVTGVKTKKLNDDFDYVLEIPQVLFFWKLVSGRAIQKREYLLDDLTVQRPYSATTLQFSFVKIWLTFFL